MVCQIPSWDESPNGRQGVAGLWFVKTGVRGLGRWVGKLVGSRTRQRRKSARDCAVGLLRLVGLCSGVARRKITNIELSGVRKYFGDGMTEPRHVTLSLIGRFKQVEGEQQHFIPVAAMTGSGLRIKEWVERLLKEKEMTGVISGFMFLRKDGKTAWAADFEESLIERLEWIQQNMVGIIPVTIYLWAEFGVIYLCGVEQPLIH
jgi:hypothetical protein